MTDIEAVNPGTGEILEHLDQQPPEALADTLDAIRAYQADLKRWSSAIESELRRRLKTLGRTLTVFGEWEVEAGIGHESVWDVEEFETVLTELAAQGVIKPGETTEVIKRETTVRSGEANKLIRRLSGEPKAALEATRTLREKPKPMTVARSVELTAPTAEMALSEPRERAPEPTGPSQPPAQTLTIEELFA